MCLPKVTQLVQESGLKSGFIVKSSVFPMALCYTHSGLEFPSKIFGCLPWTQIPIKPGSNKVQYTALSTVGWAVQEPAEQLWTAFLRPNQASGSDYNHW